MAGNGEVKRREFITLLGGAAAVWPLAACAQQADRVRRIGVLLPYAESDHEAQSWFAAFRESLRNIGWTEGSNLRIEVRWSARDADRMRMLAKELVDLRPDAIFGVTTPVIGALARETRTIPSYLLPYLIRSAAASPRTLRIRAATSPASRPTIPHWAVNGWGY
jgi:putative ABC transport system substrate-binding protein